MFLKKPGSILLLTLCLFLVVSSLAFAAPEISSPFKVKVLDISVMPEYDTSDVLILYGVDFVNTSSEAYAGPMRFKVPAGTTNNIVKESAKGNHVNVQVESKDGYAEFVWQPTQPIAPNETYSIHLEYYYNPLPGTGLKEFVYKFTPDWPVDQLGIYILEPLKSEGIKIEPAATLLGKDSKGFNTYKKDYFNVPAGNPIELKVSYTKNDPKPSVDPPSAQQNAQFTTQPVTQSSSLDPMSIAIMVFLGLIAVAAVVLMIKRLIQDAKVQGQSQSGQKTRPRSGNPDLEKEKRQLRKRLLDGEISEDTYHMLLREIEEDYR